MSLFDRTGKKHLPPTSGRIAIGKKGEKKNPIKLDYFIFTHEHDPKTDIAPINVEMTRIMEEKYGKQPRSIRVILPFHHPDEVFFKLFMDYKGRNDWSCKSEDGYTAIRKNRDGSICEVECNYETCQFRKNSNSPDITSCHMQGILSVEIPESPTIGGLWKFRTKGWGSCNEIYQSLMKIFEIRGTLKNLEVMMTVRMDSQIVPDGRGGKQRQNVPVVKIASIGTREELQNGIGTAYGDFAKLKELGMKIGNNTDIVKMQALSMEATKPLESDDDETAFASDTETNNESAPTTTINNNDDNDLF